MALNVVQLRVEEVHGGEMKKPPKTRRGDVFNNAAQPPINNNRKNKQDVPAQFTVIDEVIRCSKALGRLCTRNLCGGSKSVRSEDK